MPFSLKASCSNGTKTILKWRKGILASWGFLRFGHGCTKFSSFFSITCMKNLYTSKFEIYWNEILVKFENRPKLCSTSSFSLICFGSNGERQFGTVPLCRIGRVFFARGILAQAKNGNGEGRGDFFHLSLVPNVFPLHSFKFSMVPIRFPKCSPTRFP